VSSTPETAVALQVPAKTVPRDWKFGRTWLEERELIREAGRDV
jgi:hypothetical protein